jgi:hypothetical protein
MAPAEAQTKKSEPKTSTRSKKVITKSPVINNKPAVVAPAPAPAVVITDDTTAKKKDTTAVEQVAQVVHDSVKAQIKAPIVQVPVTLKSLIIPGVLFAYGAVTLNNETLRKLNLEVKEYVWDNHPHNRNFIENYGLLLPAAAVYALNIAGIKGQNNLIDRSIIYGMSNAIANGIGFGVKAFGTELRPDSSDKYSFPSGHTAEAFVSAEFFHQEYKGRIPWPYIAAGYAVGVGTAYMRMYNNKHWLGDVVAGAGVGIASTRFAYYIYPLLKHVLFGSRKVKESAMIMPTYRTGGGLGLTMMYSF